MYSKNDVIKPKRDVIPPGVEFITLPIEVIEPDLNRVKLVKDGRVLYYDFLVIATGTRTHPEQTPGLCEHDDAPSRTRDSTGTMRDNVSRGKSIFDFYTIEGAQIVFI